MEVEVEVEVGVGVGVVEEAVEEGRRLPRRRPEADHLHRREAVEVVEVWLALGH